MTGFDGRRYDAWVPRYFSVDPCKYCGNTIRDARTRNRRYCDAECRHSHWYAAHRTLGPTRDDYADLFALLEKEEERYEGSLVGYSIVWFGHPSGRCEFPERGRVTRRDSIDGSIQFSDLPYWNLTQLPKGPKPGEYRVFCWVKSGDTIEPLHSEWCRLNRGNRNVYFYDEKLCFYDSTGLYKPSQTQTWPRGERRPLPPGAKRRVRRKKECVPVAPPFVSARASTDGFPTVTASSAVPTQVSPSDAVALLIPALAAQLEPIRKAIGENREELGALAQRVDRVDSRLDRPEASTTSTKTDHALHSHLDKVQADLRKLQEELSIEKAAREKAEAEAKKAAEQAESKIAMTEKLLAQAMVELAHLRSERDALLAKQAMRSVSTASPPRSEQTAIKPVPTATRPVGRAVAQSVTDSAPSAMPSSIGKPPADSAPPMASIATEPAEAVIPGEPPQERQTANPTASAPSEVPVPEKPTPPPTEGTAPIQPRGKDPPLPYLEFTKEVLRQQPFGPPKSTGQQKKKPKKKWR